MQLNRFIGIPSQLSRTLSVDGASLNSLYSQAAGVHKTVPSNEIRAYFPAFDSRSEFMARSDLLISLAKAGTSGDQVQFRKTLEAIVAEERAKKHDLLADQLDRFLSVNGAPTRTESRSVPSSTITDLFFEITPRRRLSELVLPEAVSAACHELVEEHARREILRSHNLDPRHRLLLAGAPGNGKTTLAEAIATGLMVPLIVARYDGLIGSYLGETASRLRRLFDYVRPRACVLFFDEFDTLAKERGDIHETGEIKRVVSSLLMQVDSLPPHVIVITATNHPELLDRAVWRRFQLRLELPMPARPQIERYLETKSVQCNLSLDTPYKSIAEKLVGASFAEIEEFIGDIARRYVLSLPNANMKKIVAERLAQWKRKYRPRKAASK
jgi:AAA+ superfamily predicted ATPase